MRREYNVLKIFFKFGIYAGIIIGIMEIASYTSLGELKGMELSLSRVDLAVLLALQTATIAMAYPVFIWTKRRAIKTRPGFVKFEIHSIRMHRFMLILLSANILFSARTGNAVLGRIVTSAFSFLFNIIPAAPIFAIYYICARDTKKSIYWLNVILYSVFRFMCGWSGHIMTIFFWEMFLRIKHKRQNVLVKAALRLNDILVVALFMAGSWLYRFVFPMKNAIRYGIPIQSMPFLSFFKGMEELLSRFTNFPATVAAVQNHAVMAETYRRQGKPFWEVESILSPLLPRFLMPNKEYRTFSNIVKWAVYPDFTRDTGTGYNAFVYWANILEADFSCFLLAVIVFMILFILTKNIIYAFDNGSRDVEVLYFDFLLGIFSGANFSTMFGYGYIPLVYAIPILMVLGVIKMKVPIRLMALCAWQKCLHRCY